MMAWPFSRRRKDPSADLGKRLPLAQEDQAVLEAVGEWWSAQHEGHSARMDQAALVLSRQGSKDPLVVARARKGKLVRLEVHEPSVRSRVDALVKEFEKRGLWSFNGVVRTVE